MRRRRGDSFLRRLSLKTWSLGVKPPQIQPLMGEKMSAGDFGRLIGPSGENSAQICGSACEEVTENVFDAPQSHFFRKPASQKISGWPASGQNIDQGDLGKLRRERHERSLLQHLLLDIGRQLGHVGVQQVTLANL